MRPGGDDEPCDFIYVQCLGRTPNIVQVRDHGVAIPDEWRSIDAIDLELYLRVCVSQRARVAAVQQVAIDLVRDPGRLRRARAAADPGVYDLALLHRMQKLVAILPAYDLSTSTSATSHTHRRGLRRGELARAASAVTASIANYLFFPQPPDHDHHLGHRVVIDDEVRDTLRELVAEIGAISARIVEDDDLRTGVPARTLALGGGEYLRVELSTRTDRQSHEHDVEAAFERATRQLRAIRRRWEVARLPEGLRRAGPAADRRSRAQPHPQLPRRARRDRSRDQRVLHRAVRC